MGTKQKKRKLRAREIVIMAVSVVLILAVAVTCFGLYVWNSDILAATDSSGNTVSLTSDEATPSDIRDKVVTFLILGIADDESLRESTNLTDVIIVATFDVQNKTLSMLQVPRDTYVWDLTPTGKINALYKQDPATHTYGGINGLRKLLNEMFGLHIDHYVTLKMDAFRTLVDAIGGVEMEVPVSLNVEGTYIEQGLQTLNGQQAMAVVRYRKGYSDADLGRLRTQRAFLSALADECLSLSMSEMTSLIPIVMQNVTTDLTAANAFEMYQLVQGMNSEDIVMEVLPGNGVYVSGQAVYGIYPERTAKILNDHFRPYSAKITAEDLQIPDIVVEPPMEEESSLSMAQ